MSHKYKYLLILISFFIFNHINASESTKSLIKITTLSVSKSEASFEITYSPRIKYCRYYLGDITDKDEFISDNVNSKREGELAQAIKIEYKHLDANTEYVFYTMIYDRLDKPVEMKSVKIKTPQ